MKYNHHAVLYIQKQILRYDHFCQIRNVEIKQNSINNESIYHAGHVNKTFKHDEYIKWRPILRF